MRIPSTIKLHKRSQTLELSYSESERYLLPAEFLRVYSPSAEVRGHGKEVLQYGKQQVALTRLEPAGQYALKLYFDDGHESGLYSWDYLEHLAKNQHSLWQDYLAKLQIAGKSRDPHESAIKLML